MAAHECLLNSFNLINGVGYGYPDDFGGDYIDGDKLCVFVATTNAEIIERYKSILIDYIDAIEFIKVKHSYNYLYTLCEKYANELAQKFIVTGYYVDIKENTAVICINPVEHRLALQYLDKNKRSEQNSIELKAEAETEPTATLYGGDRINFNGTDQASLSICGTYNTSNAIATCGHSLVDYYYVYNGTSTTTQIGVNV